MQSKTRNAQILTLNQRDSLIALVRFLLFVACAMSIVAVCFPHLTRAQSSDDLTEVTVETISSAATPQEAVRESLVKAAQSTARTQVIELLGDKKYQKNKQTVESRIVKQFEKFVPFSNASEPLKTEQGYRVSVQLKISLGSLKQMVQQAGLLVDTDGNTSLLTLVAFEDQIRSQSYRWWTAERSESQKLLSQLSLKLNEAIFAEFLKQGFSVLRPIGQSSERAMPEAFRVGRHSNDDLKFLSDYFRSPLILSGDVRIRSSKALDGGTNVSVRLTVTQSLNSKAVGDLTRSFDFEKGLAESVLMTRISANFNDLSKDLAGQVLEVWQRGTLGANTINLSLRGQLNPKQLQDFKSEITKTVKEIKAIRERRFEPGKVTFEIDFTGDAKGIGEKFKSTQLAAFQIQVTDSNDRLVAMDVKAK